MFGFRKRTKDGHGDKGVLSDAEAAVVAAAAVSAFGPPKPAPLNPASGRRATLSNAAAKDKRGSVTSSVGADAGSPNRTRRQTIAQRASCSINGLHGLGITRVYLPDGSFRTLKAEKFNTCGEVLRFVLAKTPMRGTSHEEWALMVLTKEGGECKWKWGGSQDGERVGGKGRNAGMANLWPKQKQRSLTRPFRFSARADFSCRGRGRL